MATDDAMPERWLPVPGWGGCYEVSDMGRVRSVDRVVIYSDGRRYSYRGKARLVHQLVLEAFAVPRPRGEQARHGPGGATDNRLVNLCWGTGVENMADKERDGTLLRGDSHQGARLTEAIVLKCRRRYVAGETQTALAAEYGVSVGCMSFAVRGITWSWLPHAVSVRPGYGGKLAPEIAGEARRRYAAGESRVTLAAEYGVTRGTLWRVTHRKN